MSKKQPPEMEIEKSNCETAIELKILKQPGNGYKYIEDKCRDLNISISQLCRTANVDRQFMSHFKVKEPKTIQSLKSILSALRELEQDVLASQEEIETETLTQND